MLVVTSAEPLLRGGARTARPFPPGLRRKGVREIDEVRPPANPAVRVTFNVNYPAAPARIRVHRALISAATPGDVKPAHDAERSDSVRVVWVAHASRVLAIAPTRSRTLFALPSTLMIHLSPHARNSSRPRLSIFLFQSRRP